MEPKLTMKDENGNSISYIFNTSTSTYAPLKNLTKEEKDDFFEKAFDRGLASIGYKRVD